MHKGIYLCAAFPNLPVRSRFNRLLRHQYPALIAYFRYLVRQLNAQHCAFEALDAMGVPTRDAKRRGLGWLPGLADIVINRVSSGLARPPIGEALPLFNSITRKLTVSPPEDDCYKLTLTARRAHLNRGASLALQRAVCTG